jgi:hypothetical protein
MSSYDPERCEAFSHNQDPPFTVPAGGEHRLTLDLTYCGGNIQNYQVTLMNDRRRRANAQLQVLDASGQSIGATNPAHSVVFIGDVPADAIYTIVVQSGSKAPESCILFFSGSI